MANKYRDLLIDVIIQINENILETRGRKSFAENKELDYIEGKLMAYKEMLEIIKLEAETEGIRDVI